MPRAIEILGGTSIAATSWKIGDRAHISLFAQYNDGGIRESRWDEETGWTGGKTPDDIIIQSTYHSTKLAAININNGKKVCVYYTWSDSISGTTFLGEICQDDGGSWYSGELSRAGVVVASNSGIAACGPVMGERDITVLYYRPDYYMCEVVFSKGAWSQRAIVDVSYNIKSTSGSYLDISAIVCPRPPGDIIQASYINNSNYGALMSTNPNGTWWTYSGGGYSLVTGEDPVRGAAVYNGQGSLNPKIYSMKSGDDLVMEWTGTPNPLGGISWTSATVQNCYPLAGVAVVGAFVNATDPERAPIRLYYQDKETNQVKQRRWLEGYKTWAEVDVDHDIVPTGTVVT